MKPPAINETIRAEWECANCHIRPGTVDWVGENGMAGYIHGWFEKWCERCVLEAQIAYAELRAASLPGLRERLEELPE